MFVISIHLVHGKSPRRDSILGSKWMNTIPPTSQVEWSFAPAWIHLFFFIRRCCHFRTSEAAGPGCATICPPHSKNTLPESAACDVEIQKCTAAFASVTECLGAAERCQMSAHVLRVSRPAAFTFSLPVLLSVSAVCISWTATCLLGRSHSYVCATARSRPLGPLGASPILQPASPLLPPPTTGRRDLDTASQVPLWKRICHKGLATGVYLFELICFLLFRGNLVVISAAGSQFGYFIHPSSFCHFPQLLLCRLSLFGLFHLKHTPKHTYEHLSSHPHVGTVIRGRIPVRCLSEFHGCKICHQ